MSTEHNKAVVRRFFEEIYNQGDLALAGELFGADFGGPGGSHHAVRGPEAARRAVAAMRAAFPDICFTVEDLIAEDDQVVVRVTFRGTHRGLFMGIAPTGRQVTGSGVELAQLAGGKIVAERWHHYDLLHLLDQLGAVHIRRDAE
jgi:predicted ester cyclase